MRERSRDRERLQHIIEAINRIENYTRGVDYDAFIANGMMYYAVLMNISIIGEAANLLTFEFREEHPETQWKFVVGTRNYMVHEYFQVDNVVVWDVITNDLPILKQQINKYLSEME